nr:(deoxy)nucleoside triphosphate pyrophosphohydrolase [Actinomadura pelletieri]
MKALITVVAAAIFSNGRLLSAQRAEPPHMAGGWELPGGKVDPGESDEDALVRECHEELAIKIGLGPRIGGDWHLSERALLRVWTAHIIEGEPQALEHLALRWLTRENLYDVDWLPGDRPVIDAITAQNLLTE